MTGLDGPAGVRNAATRGLVPKGRATVCAGADKCVIGPCTPYLFDMPAGGCIMQVGWDGDVT